MKMFGLPMDWIRLEWARTVDFVGCIYDGIDGKFLLFYVRLPLFASVGPEDSPIQYKPN